MIEIDEDARLDALYQLNLLDTSPNEAFDRVTRMAAQLFGLPIAAVSLTDRDRQWFKSRVGVEHTSIPREKAPCGAVAESNELLVVPDLLDDPCYRNSVLASQGVRFYAGAPLVTREGFGLGALCVLGTEPRTVTEHELAALNDLAQIVMSQIELQHAFGRIDPLSGLPNRTQFLDDVGDLERDHPGEDRIAVLLDLLRADELDQGMRVMGPSYIDEMVQDRARLIRAMLDDGQTAYHVAATQFAVLVRRGVDNAAFLAHLPALVERFKEQTRKQFVVTPVVGAAPFTLGAISAVDVLRCANGAVQDARTAGLSVSVYSASSDSVYKRSFALLNDFSYALRQEDQVRLVFQPRIELGSGRIIGAEALLRWRHPQMGDISPAEFIPIIEKTALAKQATAWVMDTALRQLGAWTRSGLDCRLSLNVSAANLEESDFVESAGHALQRHDIAPELVELEITESAFMANTRQTMDTLNGLRDQGFALAIDDFGTGYSSLAYLQRLPATVLKIDRSFIRDLSPKDPKTVALVRSMLTLSRDMGYRVVAEGVEQQEAADLLLAMGCEEAQGYLFSRPLEAWDFEELLCRSTGTKPLLTAVA
ncbi:putative bifunctional diguanylate cyclase/phosphodiesterase [Tianweitania sediminis]|uniref:Sensor domain-containing phosphodiesterase n=1 Tax=Tianweitania sediminis TaxID=1502156 RepID=A0A8J7UI52_9HYPH|nr:sensor domain-containing phosphodiesterase [Tianweitania sediminis]MBP0437309.1 sensor domain-containing phosphodiesterase [Tianweitania sediminis]